MSLFDKYPSPSGMAVEGERAHLVGYRTRRTPRIKLRRLYPIISNETVH